MKVNNPLRSPLNLEWLGLIALLLLIIHTVRMSADVSLVGMIPPMTATIGDLLIAVVAFWVVVLPLRMAWRKATRGLERRLCPGARSGFAFGRHARERFRQSIIRRVARWPVRIRVSPWNAPAGHWSTDC